MPFLDKLGQIFSFGKKDNMAQAQEFDPTDIIKHRYQDPQVLVTYLKTLSEDFTDENVKIKKLSDGRLGLMLPRKLKKIELEGALNAFEEADRDRKMNDDD